MRRLKVLGLAAIAVFVLGAIAAAAASAAAVELPTFTAKTTFKGTSGKGKLNLTGAEIKCESATNEGSPTSKRLGKFTIDFKSCTLGGKECHSEGDAEGIILVGGEYHLVRLGAGKAGIWFLVNEVKIVCKFLSTKAAVKGNVLGGVEPVGTKTTSFTLSVNVNTGKQEFTEFENNEGVKEKAKLEGSVNGGAFKEATEESAENKITTAEETEVIFAKGPLYKVNTVELKEGESVKAIGKGTLTILVAGIGLEIKCTTLTEKMELIGGAPGTNADKLEYTGCKVEKPANCTVVTPITFETNTILKFLIKNAGKWMVATEAEWEAAAEKGFGDKFWGKGAGELISTIKVEGANCTDAGTYELKGNYTGRVNNGLEFISELDHLTVNGKEAVATGLLEYEGEKGEKLEVAQ